MPAVATSSPPPAAGPRIAGSTRVSAQRADVVVLVLALSVPLAVTLWGWNYYASPLGVRLRHDLHDLLRPSVGIGLALGITALSGFLFLWLYPLRKSIRALAWMGPLGEWLRVHIVVGLSVPLYAAVHAGWRFDGLIGLGYLSMFIVALSGIVGRYLYTHIPRTKQGLEMSREDVGNERRALITDIAAATGRSPAEIELAMRVQEPADAVRGPVAVLMRMLRDDHERRRALTRLRRDWATPRPGRAPIDPQALSRALRLAQREMALLQQVRVLEATRRLFGLWHVAHRPFAFTALIAVLVHVVVAVLFTGIGRSAGWPR